MAEKEGTFLLVPRHNYNQIENHILDDKTINAAVARILLRSVSSMWGMCLVVVVDMEQCRL